MRAILVTWLTSWSCVWLHVVCGQDGHRFLQPFRDFDCASLPLDRSLIDWNALRHHMNFYDGHNGEHDSVPEKTSSQPRGRTRTSNAGDHNMTNALPRLADIIPSTTSTADALNSTRPHASSALSVDRPQNHVKTRDAPASTTSR
eukprot:GSA25T00014358001.1